MIHSPNRGNNGSQAHVNFWYNPDKGTFEVNGYFYLEDSSYVHRLAPFVKANRTRNDTLTMYLYRFVIPENNTKQLQWQDVLNKAKVKVTDMFGNLREFNLSFDKENVGIPAAS